MVSETRTRPESTATPAMGSPAYLVLGMVGLGQRSGYEIKQTVELSLRFFWTISQAQIYPSLAMLERAGLITGRDEPRGRRPRRVYSITADGRAELARWLLTPEPLTFELRDLGMVKLFFADALAPEQAGALLSAVRERSEARLKDLEAIEPTALAAERDGNVHPLLTLRMGCAFHTAMIDVCRDFQHRLAAS